MVGGGGGGAEGVTTGNPASLFHLIPLTIKGLCATVPQVQVCFSTGGVISGQYSDSLHQPVMTDGRCPILSRVQVAPYLLGITAAIKSVWTNQRAPVHL